MAYDSIWVLTSKSLKTMFSEGGSGNWKARKDRLLQADYLVAMRNQHSGWAEGKEQHGSAFLIARISGVISSPPSEPGRYVIQFDKYALVNIPNAWPKGFRNPVAYRFIADLGIDLAALEWRDFPAAQPSSAKSKKKVSNQNASEVVDQAKVMIASALSINPSSVQITITL